MDCMPRILRTHYARLISRCSHFSFLVPPSFMSDLAWKFMDTSSPAGLPGDPAPFAALSANEGALLFATTVLAPAYVQQVAVRGYVAVRARVCV